MDNKFFQFVKTYEEDIKKFFEALIELIKTIFGITEEEDVTTTA